MLWLLVSSAYFSFATIPLTLGTDCVVLEGFAVSLLGSSCLLQMAQARNEDWGCLEMVPFGCDASALCVG